MVLMLVLFVTALAIVFGQGEQKEILNLLFAIAGFAGGLVVPKSDEK
jgi:hypothetical protein